MQESTYDIHPTEARWTHVALRVDDIDATIEFYTSMTPMELISKREDSKGFGAWLGMPGATSNPFILVVAQFFEGCDPFADAPKEVLAPFAHLGIELPTKQAIDEIAARAASCRLPGDVGHDDAAADRLHLHGPRPRRQHGRVQLGPGRVRHAARQVGRPDRPSGRLTRCRAAPARVGSTLWSASCQDGAGRTARTSQSSGSDRIGKVSPDWRS